MKYEKQMVVYNISQIFLKNGILMTKNLVMVIVVEID